MARSIWSGSISFGLVNIPVKLFTAVREERVQFHLLHDQDNVRLKQKMVCPNDGAEVHREHTVRGYEISPEHYVIVQDSEIEAAAPKSSRVIELQDFVDLAAIDPVYFDRAYYLVPQQHAEKAYRLLVEAMAQTKKVGIAKFTLRNKEYLAALRAVEGVICLETMHFADEVTPADKVEDAPRDVAVGERELAVAGKLIESLSTNFEPGRYHDEYRERLMALIQKKAHGEKVVIAPEKADGQKTASHDLMAALEASLSRSGKKGIEKSAPAAAAGRRRAVERNPAEPGGRRRKSA